MKKSNLLAAAITATAVLMSVPVHALEVRTTAEGIAYLSGGVSLEEVEELQSKGRGFGLSLLTAARGSGAHLSDAQVRIVNARNVTVLETTMTGPYLMVGLPPGNYRVEATVDGDTQRVTTAVPANGQRKLVLYFKSTAELSPDLKPEAKKE